MIQDLNDLVVLGKENLELLQVIHFDMFLPEKAAQMSREITEALARGPPLVTENYLPVS